MQIKIVISTGEEDHVYPTVVVRSVFPEVVTEIYSEDAANAVNFVKGTCLHAVGDFKHVPDTVTFEVEDKR